MARVPNDNTAPSAKPSDKKKAMMAPAVSASCGGTFLNRDKRGTKFFECFVTSHGTVRGEVHTQHYFNMW